MYLIKHTYKRSYASTHTHGNLHTHCVRAQSFVLRSGLNLSYTDNLVTAN